ncbi:MAG: PKD domain-containing protein [bacterium]
MFLQRPIVMVVIVILLSSGTLMAQISAGGRPVSFDVVTRSDLQTVTMPPVDVAALLVEDSIEQSKGLPYRFGVPFEVDYDLQSHGTWETLDDGGRLWRLRLECPGAFSINLVYRHFRLPPGGRLFIYNADRSMVIGAFTEQNNKEYQQFATGLVAGDVSILEYYEPSQTKTPGVISIQRIIHGYKNLFSWDIAKDAAGFGGSGACNNNVNCPEGAEWQDDKRSVAMILTSGGWRLCTGALVNNVRQDQTPYFLTADHCLGGEQTWVFMFNYESPSCSNIDGPTWMTVSGSTLRANNSYSDFALLELTEMPPDSYEVYYAGWSAVNSPASSSVGIHHPSGDIKKISFDYDPVTTSGVFWQIGQWEDGTTEPGSSGSPLFDSTSHRIIGQLCCGTASCQSLTSDYYGKFSLSWNNGGSSSTQLKDWLDPDNTGTLSLDGSMEPKGVSFTADATVGWVPLEVQFTGSSSLPVDAWTWDFGDGDSALVQSPSHIYNEAGMYDVTLQIISGSDTLNQVRTNYVAALADTLHSNDTSVTPGSTMVLTIMARHNVPVNLFRLPLQWSGTLDVTYDSFSTVGCRTDYFAVQQYAHFNPAGKEATIKLQASSSGTLSELSPGYGPIAKLYLGISGSASPGQSVLIDMTGYSSYEPEFSGSRLDYRPEIVSATLAYLTCCVGVRGNADGDIADEINVGDLTYLIAYLFSGGPVPPCEQEADVDSSGDIIVSDISYLVAYLFKGGPSPYPCP